MLPIQSEGPPPSPLEPDSTPRAGLRSGSCRRRRLELLLPRGRDGLQARDRIRVEDELRVVAQVVAPDDPRVASLRLRVDRVEPVGPEHLHRAPRGLEQEVLLPGREPEEL